VNLEELEEFHKSLDDQFSVPEEEREAAIATLEVGKYKGDDPLPFRKKKREEFDKLKGERQEVIGNVHAAQQFKKDLEAQYTPLNRAKRFFKDLFSPDATVSKPRDSPKSSQAASGSTKTPSAIPTPDELLISKPAPKASTGKPKKQKPLTREEVERQMVEAGQSFDLPAPSILDAYKQMPGMSEIANLTERRNAQTLMEAQRPGAKSLIPPKGPGFQDPQQEAKFQDWYKRNFVSRGLNPNPDDPQHFYDYRGAFKAGLQPGADGHMDSRFKLPGHPRTYVDTPEGRLNTVTGKIVGKPQPGSSIIGMDGEAIPLPDDLPTPQEDVLEVPEVHVTGTMPTPGELASQWTEDLRKTGRELMEAPPVQSVGQGVTEAAHNFMQGLAEMPAGGLKAIAIASRSLDRILPESLRDDRPIEERGTYKLGVEIDKLAKRLFPTDPAMQKNFIVGVLPRAVGSMTGFLAGGAAGAIAKAPVTTTAILGASVGGADQFEDAKEHKAAPDVQEKAFWLGSAVGSSEALPIAGIINRFNKATGGRFVQVLKESGVSAAQEFIQEYFQQAGSNVVAQQLYNENRSWFEGAGMGGSAGGGSGAVVGFLSGLLGARKARIRSQQNQTESQNPLFTEPEPSPAASLPDELNVTTPGQRPPFLMKQPQAPSVPPSPVPPPDMAVHPGQEQGGRHLQAMTPEMVQPEPVAMQPEPVAEPSPPVQAAPVPRSDQMTDDMHEAMAAEMVPFDEAPTQLTEQSPVEMATEPEPVLPDPVEATFAVPEQVDPASEPRIITTDDGRFQVQRPDGTFLTNPVTGRTTFKTEAKAQAAIDGTIDVKPKKQPKAVKALPAPADSNKSDISYVPPIGRVDTIAIQKLRDKNWAQFDSPESGAPRKSFTKGPIVLNADGKVIDGTHRLREAVVRGDAEIDVVQARPEQIAADGRFIMQERQIPDNVLEVPDVRVEGDRPTRTVEDIHKLAEEKGIPWDKDPAFMDLTERTTGKRHLDELSPMQLE
jgi:ketosteroid isomerase-like protein